MIKINIIGSIFGSSGYDSHTRSLANALYKVADCRLSTQLPPDWMKHVNDKELDMLMKPDRKDDYNLIITMPQMWKMFTGLGKNIGYCVWEGDSVPKSFIEEFENPNIDYIFVPSQHTKNAIMKTWHYYYDDKTIEEKLVIIPHGVDRNIFHSLTEPEGSLDVSNSDTGSSVPIPSGDTFKFICNKGWRGTNWDRGGVQYVIKAFASEFSKDEKVQLIVKLNPAYINPEQIQQAIADLKLSEDRAPIHITSDILPFDKLSELYKQANCYVCATRAEAFNLPGLEAMSCGLPTIQTDYGGQTDYMNQNNSLKIDYILEEVKEDLMYEGIRWGTPDMNDLRKQLRWAFNNQDKIKEMGRQAEEDSKGWTWDKSAEKIMNSIQ